MTIVRQSASQGDQHPRILWILANDLPVSPAFILEGSWNSMEKGKTNTDFSKH